MAKQGPTGAILVVGGGIAGIQASLDAAQAGFSVHMIDVHQQRLGGPSLPLLMRATQLMLLAFGADERARLLDRAITDARPPLRARRLLCNP